MYTTMTWGFYSLVCNSQNAVRGRHFATDSEFNEAVIAILAAW
jgi:hypothetical protein